jgi:hypothetical protein
MVGRKIFKTALRTREGVFMAGHIKVCREADNCGCNSDMEITATNNAGTVVTGTVANGGSTTLDVPDGEYRVAATLGVKSNLVDVTVSGDTATLAATIHANQLHIDSVKLCKK